MTSNFSRPTSDFQLFTSDSVRDEAARRGVGVENICALDDLLVYWRWSEINHPCRRGGRGWHIFCLACMVLDPQMPCHQQN